VIIFNNKPEQADIASLVRNKHGNKCTNCGKPKAEILMTGYAADDANLLLCPFCATQLARKLLEDLCELAVTGMGKNSDPDARGNYRLRSIENAPPCFA